MGHDSIADTSIYVHVSDKLKQLALGQHSHLREAVMAIIAQHFFKYIDEFFSYRQNIYEISPPNG